MSRSLAHSPPPSLDFDAAHSTHALVVPATDFFPAPQDLQLERPVNGCTFPSLTLQVKHAFTPPTEYFPTSQATHS